MWSECIGAAVPAVLPQTRAKASAADWDFCELKPTVLLPTNLVSFHHDIHRLLENKMCVYSQIGLSEERLQ